MRSATRFFLVLGLAFGAWACAPEYVDSEVEGGWMRSAVGLCEAESGRDVERSCTAASECSSYCCECENGTQYTVAVCFANAGCAGFGDACAAARDSACE